MCLTHSLTAFTRECWCAYGCGLMGAVQPGLMFSSCLRRRTRWTGITCGWRPVVPESSVISARTPACWRPQWVAPTLTPLLCVCVQYYNVTIAPVSGRDVLGGRRNGSRAAGQPVNRQQDHWCVRGIDAAEGRRFSAGSDRKVSEPAGSRRSKTGLDWWVLSHHEDGRRVHPPKEVLHRELLLRLI